MRTSDDSFAGGASPADQSAPTDRDAAPDDAVAGDGVADEAAEQATLAAGEEMPAAGEGDTARRELEEMRDKYLRLAAEYDNYRKRTQRERLEAGTRGQAELARRLLETLDDLDRFAQVDPATASAQSVIEGVDMVGRKLTKALTAAGLEVVDPTDQPFDPNLHEAITTMPAASAEDDGTVAQVYQKGYRFGGQLLRPARVAVRQWNG